MDSPLAALAVDAGPSYSGFGASPGDEMEWKRM